MTLHEHNDAQYEKLLNSGTINSWVAGRTMFNVRRRREYGPGAISTQTRTVQAGKYWREQPVDGSEKSALNVRLSEVTDQFLQLKQDHSELKEKKGEVQKKSVEIAKKIVSSRCLADAGDHKLTISKEELRKQKSELQSVFTRWQGLPRKLGMFDHGRELACVADSQKRIARKGRRT